MAKANLSAQAESINRRDVIKSTGALVGATVMCVAENAIGATRGNDRKIIGILRQQAAMRSWADAIEPHQWEAISDSYCHEDLKLEGILAQTPADSWHGLRAKIEWLQQTHRENMGIGCTKYSDGRVLVSMFEDALRLTPCS